MATRTMLITILSSAWILLLPVQPALHAQACGYELDPAYDPYAYQYTVGDDCLLEVRVAIHIMNDGNPNHRITEAQANSLFDAMRQKFIDAGTNIQLVKHDYGNNTFVELISGSTEWASFNLIQLRPHNVSNALNIYCIYRFLDPYAGFSVNPAHLMAVGIGCDAKVWTHEMGHTFTLIDTHGRGGTGPGERVVRPGTPGSCQPNCELAGDMLCDTEAEPYNNGNGIANDVDAGCNYTGVHKDDCGFDYIANPHNYMSYTRSDCADSFTPMQIHQMRTHAVNAYRNMILDNTAYAIQLVNAINARDAGGEIAFDGTDDVPSTSFVNVNKRSRHYAETMMERTFLDGQWYKHHDWNGRTDANFFMTRIPIVDCDVPLTTQSANFLPIHPATITDDFLELPSVHKSVVFKDPWFVFDAPRALPQHFFQDNAFREYPTPFSPTGCVDETTGGVFLGQATDDIDNAYYTVKLPNGYQYIGQNWVPGMPPATAGDMVLTGMTSEPQSSAMIAQEINSALWEPGSTSYGVQFLESNALVTARYKAHLITDMPSSTIESNCATCPNSQRKVDYVRLSSGGTDIDAYAAVYESSGKTWFLESATPWDTWDRETLMSDPASVTERPCIATGFDGSYIAQIVDDSWVDILHRKDGHTFHVGELSHLCWSDASPAIEESSTAAGGLYTILAVWEAHTMNTLRFFARDNAGHYTYGAIPDCGTFGMPVTPSLAFLGEQYFLVWREHTIVFYKAITVQTVNGQIVMNYGPTEMVSHPNMVAIGAPTITMNVFCETDAFACINANIAWTNLNINQQREIAFRRRHVGEFWQPIAIVSPVTSQDEYWAPSIAAIVSPTNTEDLLRIACNKNDGQDPLPVLKYNNTLPWFEELEPDEALHPNTVNSAPNLYGLEIHPVGAPAPFTTGYLAITTSRERMNFPKRPAVDVAKELLVGTDDERYSLIISSIDVSTGAGVERLRWKSDRGDDGRVVTTDALDMRDAECLEYTIVESRTASTERLGDATVVIEMVRASDGAVLARMHEYLPARCDRTPRSVRVRMDVRGRLQDKAFVRMRLASTERPLRSSLIDRFMASVMACERQEHLSISEALPGADRLSLEPSMPSASATLRYELEDQGFVTIIMYNNHGRALRTLVEGSLAAGSYSVTFDVQGLPAGVYFCSMFTDRGRITRRLCIVR